MKRKSIENPAGTAEQTTTKRPKTLKPALGQSPVSQKPASKKGTASAAVVPSSPAAASLPQSAGKKVPATPKQKPQQDVPAAANGTPKAKKAVSAQPSGEVKQSPAKRSAVAAKSSSAPATPKAKTAPNTPKVDKPAPEKSAEEETAQAPADEADEASATEEKKTFAELGVIPELCAAANAMKWKYASTIQAQAIPAALAGNDVIGLAETGSGKTGAFGIPMLQALMAAPQPYFALVLAPTRELAVQIAEQIEALGSVIHVRCCVIVGGVDMMEQQKALALKPHVIVATPGRIVDHLENTKGFDLKRLKFLVLDEADRLLDLDFEKPIMTLLSIIPKERRTFLFSATMTTKVEKLQRASLTKPVKVEVSRKYQTVKGLVQNYVFIPAKYKDVYTTYILHELAGNSFIIFVSTCEHAQRLALMLRHLGFPAVPLHGKMAQPKRLGALNKFKSGERKILIATDVASRGLDIPKVDVVLNYDIPSHSKDYIHRVGRTARAGRSGRAINMVTQYDVELFQRIEKLIEVRMEQYPCPEESALTLLERVSEAQRIATMELREGDKDRKANKKARRADAGAGEGEEGGEGKVSKKISKHSQGKAGRAKGPNKFHRKADPTA